MRAPVLNPEADIIRCLRLGWLTAEVYGLVRRGALNIAPRRRRAEGRTGRLVFSDRDFKNDAVRLELDWQVLLSLASRLGVHDPSDEKNPLAHLAHALELFLWRPRKVEAPGLGDVHAALLAWSNSAWADLAAQSELAACAFSYGASIADTFWFMRPNEGGDPRSEKETWEALLAPWRLTEEGQRIRELAPYFTPHLARALGYSLHRWGIAEHLRTLVQQSKDGRSEGLPEGIERRLLSNLEAQARIWRDLIMGERTAESYLFPADRLRVRAGHITTFALLSGAVLFLMFLVVWIVVSIASLFFPSMWSKIISLQANAQGLEVEIGEILSGISMLAALVGGLWVAGKWMFQQQFRLYDWVGHIWMEHYVCRRTWIPWDRSMGE